MQFQTSECETNFLRWNPQKRIIKIQGIFLEVCMHVKSETMTELVNIFWQITQQEKLFGVQQRHIFFEICLYRTDILWHVSDMSPTFPTKVDKKVMWSLLNGSIGENGSLLIRCLGRCMMRCFEKVHHITCQISHVITIVTLRTLEDKEPAIISTKFQCTGLTKNNC